MDNKIIIGGVLVVVALAGFYYFSQNQYQANPQPTNQKLTTPQPQTSIEANSVAIKNFAFTPANLSVKQGTKVTWINDDSAAHKIKSDAFNSGDLNQGDKFEFTFSDKGSFDYSCSIHPSMTGKIVVE